MAVCLSVKVEQWQVERDLERQRERERVRSVCLYVKNEMERETFPED